MNEPSFMSRIILGLGRLLPFFIILVALGYGAGYVTALYTDDILAVHLVGFGMGALLLIWWILVIWRQQHLWLLDLQEFFIRNKMVPFSFIKFKALAPWNMARDEARLLRTAAHEYQHLIEKVKESNKVFEKYVGSNVSDKAVKQASQSQLGGESRRVYVLFSDVRGFTSMTEQLKVDETLEILNKMFTAMEEVIAASGGEINKYIGDAILAYFRRPYGDEVEAAKTVLNTALRMQDRFDTLNVGFKTGYSKPVEIGLGIGVTAGEAIVGNLGSAKRMEFTLIGDTVNLSSRLCGIAKHGQILVNEEMARVAKNSFDLEALPPVQIKGKSGLHTPYAVMRQRISMGR